MLRRQQANIQALWGSAMLIWGVILRRDADACVLPCVTPGSTIFAGELLFMGGLYGAAVGWVGLYFGR